MTNTEDLHFIEWLVMRGIRVFVKGHEVKLEDLRRTAENKDPGSFLEYLSTKGISFQFTY